MAAQKGRLFMLQDDTTDIAALRTNSITIDSETVDITNKDSNGWRELLADSGVKSCSISASGVFTDDATQIGIQTKLLAATLNTFTMEFETGDTLAGSFQVTSMEYAGDYNGEQTYSISLESSGAITYTAA